MRGHRWTLAAIFVAMFIAGCGGSGETVGSPETASAPLEAPPLPSEIKVSLDGYEGAQNAGLLMADKLGYFDDVGLNVWVGDPLRPANTVYYVVTRMDELGVIPLPQVAIARENGLPLVAIGSVIPRPTAALIWLEGSGIRTMADLKGKTVGVSGVPFQKVLLRTVLEKAGLAPEDVEIKPVAYRLVPALLKDEVDAIVGSPNVEGVGLESQGAEPVIKRVQDFGVPAYDELAVITREDRAAADPQVMRAFMSAVVRGTAAAMKHPEAAAKLIVKSPESNPRATLRETEAQLKSTLPLLSRTGRLDSERAAGVLDWMHKEGLIESAMSDSELLAE